MTERIDFITAARDASIEWARKILATPADQLLILDTETTGLDEKDQIVQIAIIDLSGTPILNTLVKPTAPIPTSATRIHGITDEMVFNAPTWQAVYPLFEETVKGKTVIIYNAPYDLRLLRQTSQLCAMPDIFPIQEVHDAMLIYAEFVGDWNDYYKAFRWQKLEGGDHSALCDCLATLDVIRKMAAAGHTGDLPTSKPPAAPLAELLSEVARLRKLIDLHTQDLDLRVQAVRQAPEYIKVEAQRAVLADELRIMEERVKSTALDLSAATGKKTFPGVTVKDFTTRRIEYTYADAFAWATANARELIVLDSKLFEKHVLAVSKTVPVPCATISETVERRAQIATDLSDFVKI